MIIWLQWHFLWQEEPGESPDDPMVTGFDNDFISNYVSPALTTVEIQKEEVAKSAMEALLSLIRHDGWIKNKLYSQTGHQGKHRKNVIVNSNEKINKYNLPGAGERSENMLVTSKEMLEKARKRTLCSACNEHTGWKL